MARVNVIHGAGCMGPPLDEAALKAQQVQRCMICKKPISGKWERDSERRPVHSSCMETAT